MTVVSDLLFTDTKNQLYEAVAEHYCNYWNDPTNVRNILKEKNSTCKLCSLSNIDVISVLGLYYDSMPYHTLTLLDAAVVSIMSLANTESIQSIGEEIQVYVTEMNPDVIRNHFFLNVCVEREKTVNDWDVIEILRSMMFHLKTDTVVLRQYANLTKLLKNECMGKCNTFVSKDLQNLIDRHQKDETASGFFFSEKNKDSLSKKQSKDNTSNRLIILMKVIEKFKSVDY